jgi:hypothetical protein
MLNGASTRLQPQALPFNEDLNTAAARQKGPQHRCSRLGGGGSDAPPTPYYLVGGATHPKPRARTPPEAFQNPSADPKYPKRLTILRFAISPRLLEGFWHVVWGGSRLLMRGRRVGGPPQGVSGGVEVPFEGQAAVLRSLLKCKA